MPLVKKVFFAISSIYVFIRGFFYIDFQLILHRLKRAPDRWRRLPHPSSTSINPPTTQPQPASQPQHLEAVPSPLPAPNSNGQVFIGAPRLPSLLSNFTTFNLLENIFFPGFPRFPWFPCSWQLKLLQASNGQRAHTRARGTRMSSLCSTSQSQSPSTSNRLGCTYNRSSTDNSPMVICTDFLISPCNKHLIGLLGKRHMMVCSVLVLAIFS